MVLVVPIQVRVYCLLLCIQTTTNPWKTTVKCSWFSQLILLKNYSALHQVPSLLHHWLQCCFSAFSKCHLNTLFSLQTYMEVTFPLHKSAKDYERGNDTEAGSCERGRFPFTLPYFMSKHGNSLSMPLQDCLLWGKHWQKPPLLLVPA